MTSAHGSGEFRRYADQMRFIHDRLDDMVKQLREDARIGIDRDTARTRLETKLLVDLQHLTKEVERIGARVSRLESMGPSMTDTGPNAPRDEIALAREDAAKADAEEKRARVVLWARIAALLGAGGLGAIVKSVFGGGD